MSKLPKTLLAKDIQEFVHIGLYSNVEELEKHITASIGPGAKYWFRFADRGDSDLPKLTMHRVVSETSQTNVFWVREWNKIPRLKRLYIHGNRSQYRDTITRALSEYAERKTRQAQMAWEQYQTSVNRSMEARKFNGKPIIVTHTSQNATALFNNWGSIDPEASEDLYT